MLTKLFAEGDDDERTWIWTTKWPSWGKNVELSCPWRADKMNSGMLVFSIDSSTKFDTANSIASLMTKIAPTDVRVFCRTKFQPPGDDSQKDWMQETTSVTAAVEFVISAPSMTTWKELFWMQAEGDNAAGYSKVQARNQRVYWPGPYSVASTCAGPSTRIKSFCKYWKDDFFPNIQENHRDDQHAIKLSANISVTKQTNVKVKYGEICQRRTYPRKKMSK